MNTAIDGRCGALMAKTLAPWAVNTRPQIGPAMTLVKPKTLGPSTDRDAARTGVFGAAPVRARLINRRLDTAWP